MKLTVSIFRYIKSIIKGNKRAFIFGAKTVEDSLEEIPV